MSLSPRQLARRREGIAASDVAALVGVHPYLRPVDIWLQKTGRAQPFQGNRRSKWGHLLEPVIREEYEQVHEVRVEVPGTLVHRERRWQLATPDGIVYQLTGGSPLRGLEIKVHGRDAVIFGGLTYGAPGTDEVPAHELVQCAWNMEVTGLDRWDLVAFLDGAPVEYRIERDEELLEQLREASERFLVDHVRADVEPPPDGSRSWDRWLRQRWRSNTEDLVAIDTEPDLRSKVEELREARDRLADAEQEAERITQELKAQIGDRSGLTWRDFGRPKPSKVTWRFARDGAETAWQSVAGDMRTAAELATDTRQAAIAVSMIETAIAAHEGDDPEFVEAAEIAIRRIQAMHSALIDIGSHRFVEERTRIVPGSRRFNVPRHWRTSSTHKEEER